MEPQETTPHSRAADIISVVLLVADVVTLAVLGLGVVFARAWFAEMFEEFGVELPVMTRMLLSKPAWALVVLFLGAAALLVAKEGVIRKASVRLTLNLLAGLALLALAALLVVALFLPLFSLMESLS